MHIGNAYKEVNWKENQPVRNTYKFNKREREEVCAKFAHTTRHGAIEGKQQIQVYDRYLVSVILQDIRCS